MSIQAPSESRARWIALIWLAGIAAGWFLYGPHIIDDAYITFRYARNLAGGSGLVFQGGQRVLGFSAPLWTLLLSALAAAGLPLPATAIALCYAAFGALAWLIVKMGRATGRETTAMLTVAFLTISVFFSILLVSGMETMLYTALTTALLLAAIKRQWRQIGWLAGLVLFTRYDGLSTVIVALAFTAWLGGWRTAVKQSLIAAAIYAPWFLISWGYYGSPIPQTIIAKKAAHYVDWAIFFQQQLHSYLFYQPLWLLWFLAGAFGSFFLIRQDRAFAILPAWALAFGGIFFAAKTPISFFIWYLAPLFPIIFFLGLAGFEEAARRLTRWRIPRAAIPALLLLIHAHFFVSTAEELGSAAPAREEAYRQNALILNRFLKPGQKVLVGELGTLGWYLPDATILDGYGLVSPEVSAIRRQNRAWMLERGISLHDHADGTAEATIEMVRRFDPDVITTRRFYLCIEEAEHDAALKDNYVRLMVPNATYFDQVTLIRKSLVPSLKGLQAAPIP